MLIIACYYLTKGQCQDAGGGRCARRPVRRETRPANVKGHWLHKHSGRGVYSQICSVWSAQNHSGFMGDESTNDEDECSQMYFQLIYQGLNFSLGSSITIWYLTI